MTDRAEQFFAFTKGPIWDGNLISKQDRDVLVEAGYVDRFGGWNFLTASGVRVLITLGGLKP